MLAYELLKNIYYLWIILLFIIILLARHKCLRGDSGIGLDWPRGPGSPQFAVQCAHRTQTLMHRWGSNLIPTKFFGYGFWGGMCLSLAPGLFLKNRHRQLLRRHCPSLVMEDALDGFRNAVEIEPVWEDWAFPSAGLWARGVKYICLLFYFVLPSKSAGNNQSSIL